MLKDLNFRDAMIRQGGFRTGLLVLRPLPDGLEGRQPPVRQPPVRQICIVRLERSVGFSSAPKVLVKIRCILHAEARLAYRTAAELSRNELAWISIPPRSRQDQKCARCSAQGPPQAMKSR